MTGVINTCIGNPILAVFHTGLFHPNTTGEMGVDFLWDGGEGGWQAGWLQLQKQTEPEPQYIIRGLGFLGKDGNETSLMKLDGSTNRFL